jgi:hypothetical protein
MDGTSQTTAYHNAVKDAKARLDRLNVEIESLTGRQSALLTASKALETMMALRVDRPAHKETLSAVEISHSIAQRETHGARLSIEPVSQIYVHRADSTNEIQRRIDIAIGR